MTVKICSRATMEKLLQRKLPSNTAVISFRDEDKAPIDFGEKVARVMSIPKDDFGATFPEGNDLARFIYEAIAGGMNIICQCESGSCRSATCVVAIWDHFRILGKCFPDRDSYMIDEEGYYQILDALEAQARYRDGKQE